MLLETKGLKKAFGAAWAVQGVDLSLKQGRTTALLGPNGAGKTTTIRMLTGLLQPSAGEIRFVGRQPGSDIRPLIGYLPQTPAFHEWMRAEEFLVLVGELHGMNRRKAVDRAEELLERTGLAAAARRRIGGFSGGMKQRLGVAQALVQRPLLLVLDEPVSALDPVGRRDVMTLLRELRQETTILFSTHVLHDAESLCDDIVIMRDGRIALQGEMNEIAKAHQKPLLRLEVAPEAQQWLAQWQPQELPGVHELIREANGQGLQLLVNDLDAARRAVLQALAGDAVAVVKLEAGHTSLEELFMKVVGQ